MLGGVRPCSSASQNRTCRRRVGCCSSSRVFGRCIGCWWSLENLPYRGERPLTSVTGMIAELPAGSPFLTKAVHVLAICRKVSTKNETPVRIGFFYLSFCRALF